MNRTAMASMNNQGLLLLMCLCFSAAMANIGEYDEHWRQREAQARKFLEETYHPEPFNVTNEFNMQVHR